MSEIQRLRNLIEKIPYPNDVMKKVNGEIDGIGFFPGLWGMIEQSEVISNKKIMILGHDQDSSKGFQETLIKGEEIYSPTWKNLRRLLNEANIDEKDCFFTNCLMGVRVYGKSTGASPGLSYNNYVNECLALLKIQITIQKPKVIICLGNVPFFKLLPKISKELNDILGDTNTILEADKREVAINYSVKFDDVEDFLSNVAVIVHPSRRFGKNVSRRKYKEYMGNKAELVLLRDAVNKS